MPGIAGLVALVALAAGTAGAGEPKRPVVAATDTSWTVTQDGQVVCLYTFGPEQKKPYVKELAPPGGRNVLRDGPADHLHHHGLMYAIRVNGVNFWEEVPGNGVERHVAALPVEPEAPDEVAFRHRILWLSAAEAARPAAEAQPLLIEERTLRVRVEPDRRTTRLRWQSVFTVSAAEATLTGSNYNGLGARFREDLDAGAAPRLPGGHVTFDTAIQHVRPCGFGSMHLTGGPEGPVALMIDAQRNRLGTTHFFTMLKPFAYLSATHGLDLQPVRLKASERIELQFDVSVTRLEAAAPQ